MSSRTAGTSHSSRRPTRRSPRCAASWPVDGTDVPEDHPFGGIAPKPDRRYGRSDHGARACLGASCPAPGGTGMSRRRMCATVVASTLMVTLGMTGHVNAGKPSDDGLSNKDRELLATAEANGQGSVTLLI